MNQFEIASLFLNFAVVAGCYYWNRRTNKQNLDLGHHLGFMEHAALFQKALEDREAVDVIRARWREMDKPARDKKGRYTQREVVLVKDHGRIKTQ